MTDPITVGALVAGALGAGAAKAGKAVLGQAAKDAYERLKAAAPAALGAAVGRLEKKPDSDDLAAVVAEDVDAQPADVQAELRALAEALRAALDAEGRAGTVDNRVTVIAAHGGMAAGRDLNIGSIGASPGKS
jgi:hypothetical protein